MKKVWMIITASLTGAALIGGGVGIGWAIHKNKIGGTSDLPSWMKKEEWRCDAQFYVDSAAKSGKYDMWFSDEIEEKDLSNPLVLFTFPNSSGFETTSELEFRLTGFGVGFQDIEKSQLIAHDGDYMVFGIMTPRDCTPVVSTINETITWSNNTEGDEKGIKEIDIKFHCNRTYTNSQIGLAESEFDYV